MSCKNNFKTQKPKEELVYLWLTREIKESNESKKEAYKVVRDSCVAESWEDFQKSAKEQKQEIDKQRKDRI